MKFVCRRPINLLLLSSGLATLLSGRALAQDAVITSDAEVFPPSYFARFNPATADDMIRQVPGFTIDEGDSVRGFGNAAGNVLINGERPSTKTSLRTLLGRIPAANVVRIEVVTGASANLDMRGQTKVANVILKADAAGTSGAWKATGRHFQGGRLNASAEASANLPAFGGTLTLSLEAGAPGGGGPGGGVRSQSRRAYYDGSGNLFEQHAGSIRNERTMFEPAFEFKRSLDWGKLNLNGSYSAFEGEGSTFFEIHAPDFAGPITRLETQNNDFERKSYNLNGDVELPLGAASTKLILLHQRAEGSGDSLYGFYNADGSFDDSVRVRSDDTSGESIARTQISLPFGESHTFEFALEGAYNFLDSTRHVTLASGADVTPPGSDTIVEEYRGELQLSDVWQVLPELTLEPAMKLEYSQIKQEARLAMGGSAFAEREFTYPKPGITATWRPNESQQLRVSLERSVAQLDFGDFVSAVEVINDQVTAGNADLVPQKAWALNAEFEQKFWDDGVLTLVGKFARVSDVEDQVPVVPLGGSILQAFDGPGNLGKGEEWSLGFKASVPLDNLGLPDARLDMSLNSGNSEVVDPVTGNVREFSDAFNRDWQISFRQDVPEHKFSYGFAFGEGGGATSYRLKETYKRERTGGDLRVFFETTQIEGLKIRVGWNDALDPAFISNRAVYDAPRSTGNLILFQQNQSRNGPFGFVQISGTF
ncbi:MAG: TonB-dependent receptor plug domain-containing protein [Hyphomonadaceae bacterium]